MNQELSKNLVCLLTRSGVEVWMEEERSVKCKEALKGGADWLEYEDKFINKSDISGFYPAYDMEDRNRRKNGDWKCKWGKWHERFKKCGCEEVNSLDDAVAATDRLLKDRPGLFNLLVDEASEEVK